MPMPAVWAAALVNDNIESLLPADRIDCQAMIEQLRNDGYAVIGLAHNAQPRLTNQYRLYGGNTDSGMVLDYCGLRRPAHLQRTRRPVCL